MSQQQPQWMPPPPQGAVFQPQRRTSRSCVVPIFMCIFGTLLIIFGANLMHINFNFNASTGPAKVGDTITVNNVDCTLVSVKDVGGGILLLDIKLVNNSGSEFSYSSSLDFHVENEAGNITDADTDFGSLGSGNLAPNGHVEGGVVFVIAEQHNAQLLWQPDYSNDLSHAWLLGL